MKFSVVIPTLNEEQNIEQQIKHLQKLSSAEIVIADGGSSDRTVEIVRHSGVRVVESAPGRGTQLRAGATASTGDVLMFLHADTFLPNNAFMLMTEFFKNTDNLVATYRIRFQPPFFLLRMVEIFSKYDSFITKYGDQCIIIRRDFYEKIGGFPNWPIFEDVYLLEEARNYTRIHTLPDIVRSSSRKFQQNGVLRQLLWNAWLLLLYYLGRPPITLAGMYSRKL